LTYGEIKSSLTQQAAVSGIKDGDGVDIDKLVEGAISVGLLEFWKSREWSFRKRSYTLSITSATETYDLPEDFGGIITIREKASLNGMSIRFYLYEEFCERFPHPNGDPAGYPQFFTVYRDRADNHKWKARFYPMPEAGMSLYLDYLSDTVTSVSEVPNDYSPGLIEVCLKYLLPPGSTVRWSQENHIEQILDRLFREDAAFHGAQYRFGDDTDQAIGRYRPWMG